MVRARVCPNCAYVSEKPIACCPRCNTEMAKELQGALKFLIAGEEITVREGEVLHIPSWVEHQAEALDDTFELDLFSPIRQDWLDGTDTYFHRK